MDGNLRRFAEVTNQQLFDAELDEWRVRTVRTHETLAEWEASSHGWGVGATVQVGEIAGLPFRTWSNVQMNPGAMREQCLSVLDLGEVRIILPGTDLTLFDAATCLTPAPSQSN